MQVLEVMVVVALAVVAQVIRQRMQPQEQLTLAAVAVALGRRIPLVQVVRAWLS